MNKFMRRHGLTSPLGYLAALGAAVLIILSAACSTSSAIEEATTATTSTLNTDPREGRVYYDDVDGKVVPVDSLDTYLYFDVCNEDGELVRFYYRDAAETLTNHSACLPDEPTSEFTPSPSPTS